MADLASCSTLQEELVKTSAPGRDVSKLLRDEDWIHGHVSVLVGHRILVLGGMTRAYHKRKEVFILDMNNWEWKNITASQQNSGSFRGLEDRFVAMVDDKIYFTKAKGPYESFLRERTWCFDLALLTFESCGSRGEKLIPFDKSGAQYVQALGTIVNFGGKGPVISFTRDVVSNSLVGYSIERNEWTTLTAKGRPPSPRFRHWSCMHGKSDIFYLGGVTQVNGKESHTKIYHLRCKPGNLMWSQPIETRFSSSFVTGAMCCAGSRIIMFGGVSDYGHWGDRQSRILVYDLDKAAGIELKENVPIGKVPPAPASRGIFGARSKNQKKRGVASNIRGEISKLNLKLASTTDRIPFRQSSFSAVVSKYKMIIIGGTEARPTDVTVLKPYSKRRRVRPST